jgi:hypothetical protein
MGALSLTDRDRRDRRDREDDLDPELLSLPKPPRKERTLTLVVLGLAAIAALAMAVFLRHDAAYALAGGSAAPLGDLREVTLSELAPHENHFVRAEALLGAAGGIRYERPFVEDTFRTLPALGRNDVWVDVRVPSGQETGRWEPPRSFTGRLVRLEDSGPRHRGLAAAIERATGQRVPKGAWLLVDGQAPDGMKWALVLVLMFLGFSAWNVAGIVRIVRRVAE